MNQLTLAIKYHLLRCIPRGVNLVFECVPLLCAMSSASLHRFLFLSPLININHITHKMASRIANAAKGIRFASSATAANPWLAERVAIKEHAGRTSSFPFNNKPPLLYAPLLSSPPDSRHNNNAQAQFRNRTYLRNRTYTTQIRIGHGQLNKELNPRPRHVPSGSPEGVIHGLNISHTPFQDWTSGSLLPNIRPNFRKYNAFSCTCMFYPSLVYWTLSLPSIYLLSCPQRSLSYPCACINARALSLGTLSTANKGHSDRH